MLTVAENLVHELVRRGFHISFAESCTGGRAAAAIVDIPDASKVLDASFVTYANSAKAKFVKVPESLIALCGAVSEQVATAMAVGAASAANADVAVGISGIAGPGGGSDEKPVGMVCFGYYLDGYAVGETVRFGDLGRDAVRNAAVEHALAHILDMLKSYPEAE